MTDVYNLQRFLDAQNTVIDQVCLELRNGRKTSHWMWFVFPQVRGLGHSDMARKFAIASADEGRAYLGHPLLGSRLRECTALVNAVNGSTIEQILGQTDAVKFRSSMTLFSCIAPADNVFEDALGKYFGGQSDSATIAFLESGKRS